MRVALRYTLFIFTLALFLCMPLAIILAPVKSNMSTACFVLGFIGLRLLHALSICRGRSVSVATEPLRKSQRRLEHVRRLPLFFGALGVGFMLMAMSLVFGAAVIAASVVIWSASLLRIELPMAWHWARQGDKQRDENRRDV
ncbi:MAG: hypothetical protein UX98_C0017G0001 [Parcubacteria group bacterium GW2011_GWA2_47_26]|nr:MAG: hypothetical protein UX98_C0017G0001 [Parcubacteria group bacterium GW2011_GWA2_47_26]